MAANGQRFFQRSTHVPVLYFAYRVSNNISNKFFPKLLSFLTETEIIETEIISLFGTYAIRDIRFSHAMLQCNDLLS